RAAVRTALPPALRDVSAVVRLRSATEGYLALGFPQQTAAALAQRMLSGVLKEIDAALIRDCVGEIANVVAGQAKALLAGTPYQFPFSLPGVVGGGAPDLGSNPDGECLVVVFGRDLGEFAMQLFFWEPAPATTPGGTWGRLQGWS